MDVPPAPAPPPPAAPPIAHTNRSAPPQFCAAPPSAMPPLPPMPSQSPPVRLGDAPAIRRRRRRQQQPRRRRRGDRRRRLHATLPPTGSSARGAGIQPRRPDASPRRIRTFRRSARSARLPRSSHAPRASNAEPWRRCIDAGDAKSAGVPDTGRSRRLPDRHCQRCQRCQRCPGCQPPGSPPRRCPLPRLMPAVRAPTPVATPATIRR